MRYLERLKFFFYGIILGITNTIPGVSGSTVAVILNVYDDILYAISFRNFKRHFVFLALLGTGCITGILLFSHAVIFLTQRYQIPVYYCFMGLVIGSIPMIYKRARYKKIKPFNIIIFIISLCFMLLIALLQQQNPTSGESFLRVGSKFNSGIFLYLWLFLSAFISTIAMILPGISGSLIMLLLGSYTITLEALSDMNMQRILPIILGLIAGGFVGIKFIKTLLRFHPQTLYLAILGLIIGSLFTIFPGLPPEGQIIPCLALITFFSVITYLFSTKN